MDMQASHEFLAELKVLTHVHHLNLVSEFLVVTITITIAIAVAVAEVAYYILDFFLLGSFTCNIKVMTHHSFMFGEVV